MKRRIMVEIDIDIHEGPDEEGNFSIPAFHEAAFTVDGKLFSEVTISMVNRAVFYVHAKESTRENNYGFLATINVHPAIDYVLNNWESLKEAEVTT